MKYFYKAIFLLSFLLSNINCDDGNNKVLNTCGITNYQQPTTPDDCKEDGQMCCYVHIKKEGSTDTKDDIKFCVNSPSEIEKGDVESEIKEYTGYTLKDIKCNKSQFLYDSMIASLMIIFILF